MSHPLKWIIPLWMKNTISLLPRGNLKLAYYYSSWGCSTIACVPFLIYNTASAGVGQMDFTYVLRNKPMNQLGPNGIPYRRSDKGRPPDYIDYGHILDTWALTHQLWSKPSWARRALVCYIRVFLESGNECGRRHIYVVRDLKLKYISGRS